MFAKDQLVLLLLNLSLTQEPLWICISSVGLFVLSKYETLSKDLFLPVGGGGEWVWHNLMWITDLSDIAGKNIWNFRSRRRRAIIEIIFRHLRSLLFSRFPLFHFRESTPFCHFPFFPCSESPDKVCRHIHILPCRQHDFIPVQPLNFYLIRRRFPLQ